MAANRPTVARVLTPTGRGAVATIEVAGPLANEVVCQNFCPASRRDFSSAPVGRIVFGRWGGDRGEEVVACRRANDVIEIHCHGGVAASAAIIEVLANAGCHPQSWSTGVLATEQDPLAAAARIALAKAQTERTAAILLDQYRGALRRTFDEIEALAKSTELTERQAALQKVDHLLTFASLGKHLTEPWRVVIAGRPNVGKSSLTNALVGFNRAIVFDTPGTTRDVVTTITAFDGWPVQLADTAGLRATTDPLENLGIERAEQQLADNDLILLVYDGSQPWTAADEQLHNRCPMAILVHNKADLARSSADSRPAGVWTSAVTGQGLAELQSAMVNRLVPETPQPGDAIPFAREHVEYLQAWRARFHA